MRKKTIAMLLILALVASLSAKVETVADPASPTGYTTTITYTDPEATDVRLVGSFTFYENNNPYLFAWSDATSKVNDSPYNYIYGPESWVNGNMRHIQDEGFTADMVKDGDTFSYTMQLPSASYMYFFNISKDGGETWQDKVCDPDNVPPQNALSLNPQYRSQFFVPYDPEKQSPADDWTFVMPIEDRSKAGTIEYWNYIGDNGVVRPAQVYVPAGYDSEREEPYKVLYMSHGGGGFEGDWFHQGNANNIADRVIADGKVEPFLIVTFENDSFKMFNPGNNPDYQAIFKDMKEYLIPFIEEHYNVSEKAEDRGLAGLSRGANVTTGFLFRETKLFGYYALMSRGAVYLYAADTNLQDVQSRKIYMGAGFADFDLLRRTYNILDMSSVLGLAWYFDDLGVDYNGGGSIKIVPGSHDWFTWPQLALDFFSNYLWK